MCTLLSSTSSPRARPQRVRSSVLSGRDVSARSGLPHARRKTTSQHRQGRGPVPRPASCDGRTQQPTHSHPPATPLLAPSPRPESGHHLRRVEEPLTRRDGDLLERARLLEEMRRPGNDLKVMRRRQLTGRFLFSSRTCGSRPPTSSSTGTSIRPAPRRPDRAARHGRRPMGKDPFGLVSRPRIALGRGAQGADPEAHRGGGEGLLPAAHPARQDRHPAGRARQPAAQEARGGRGRDHRRRRPAAHRHPRRSGKGDDRRADD